MPNTYTFETVSANRIARRRRVAAAVTGLLIAGGVAKFAPDIHAGPNETRGIPAYMQMQSHGGINPADIQRSHDENQ